MNVKPILISTLFLFPLFALAQQPDTVRSLPAETLPTEQLETVIETQDRDMDFSDWEDELHQLRSRPVNLNATSEDELRRAFFLNELQIQNLLTYTSQFGKLTTIFELQLIEGFNFEFIEQIQPYITFDDGGNEPFSWKRAFRYGRQEALVRWQRVVEKQAGFAEVSDSMRRAHPGSYYWGDANGLFMRYTYNYRDRLRFGIAMDKDAGEPFKWGVDTLPKGFDYYAFHFYLKNIGRLKYFALGDYQLQFGQGLTLWSGLSFGKSPGSLCSRKRAPYIRPHASSNEYAYMRGAAATFTFGTFDVSGFYSNRKVDGNLNKPDDFLSEEEYVSSIQETGYHRTTDELADRKVLREQLFGGNITYNGNHLKTGITAYQVDFDKVIKPDATNYNAFVPGLNRNQYVGLNYSYAYKRLTLYGEVCHQLDAGNAFLQGLNFTPHPQLSVAMLYRNYARDYLNRLSAAFGESSTNANENGFYVGILATPFKKTTLTAYADMFQYPWLRYRVDAPSHGKEFAVQMDYRINRNTSFYVRYRNIQNPLNFNAETGYKHVVDHSVRNYIRLHLVHNPLAWISLRSRVEFVLRSAPNTEENGMILYQDVVVKPDKNGRWMFALRYALFDTESYDTRIYAYENDLPFSFSIPALYDKGSRFYLMTSWKFMRHSQLAFRIAQTFYNNKTSISSGSAQIDSNTRTELKALLKVGF